MGAAAQFAGNPSPAATHRLLLAVLFSLALHALVVTGLRFEAGVPGTAHALRVLLVPVSSPDAAAIVPPTVAEPDRTLESVPGGERVIERPPVEGRQESPTAGRADSADSVVASLPVYYDSKEVDVRAAPKDVSNRSRSERSTAMALGRIARAKIRLYISAAGTVDRFDLIEVDAPPGSLALDEIRDLRFYPALKNGQPVRSRKLVELSFLP